MGCDDKTNSLFGTMNSSTFPSTSYVVFGKPPDCEGKHRILFCTESPVLAELVDQAMKMRIMRKQFFSVSHWKLLSDCLEMGKYLDKYSIKNIKWKIMGTMEKRSEA